MTELPIVPDGAGSFIGMDSFSDPQQLDKNEYVAAMNVVSRGGIIQTRPGSRTLSCAPGHGNLQGLAFFQPSGGAPNLVLATDGIVYVAQQPFNNFTRLEGIQFSPSAKYVSFAVCLQSTDYDDSGILYVLNSPKSVLIMQDGQTKAAFWDGSVARHLNPEQSPETTLWVTAAVVSSGGLFINPWSSPVDYASGTFVPPVATGTDTLRIRYLRSSTAPIAPTDINGTGWATEPPEDGTDKGYDETKIGQWMVWSNNRLWVSRQGQIFASDIGNPLKFTESQYLNEGRAFYLNDECTGMVELTDQSGILIFTNDDATIIRSSITDRTQWLNTPDFQKVVLQNVGCVAPRSIVVQYGLIWWFSSKGITSLDAALRQNLTSRLLLQDQEMIASKFNCSPDLSGICGAFYENYLLMSVPSGDVWNRHTWVLDQDPFPASSGPANSWNSWWSGWRPVQWARGIVDGNERLFFLSKDFDGYGRVWEAMTPDRMDNGCPITCAVQTREHNFGNMELKRFKMAEIYLKEIYGSVALMSAYRSTKGTWTRVLTKQIEATAGQIYEDSRYSESGNKFSGNRPQSRTVRTSETAVTDVPCQEDCGVESGQENLPTYIDRAFSLLVAWSGRAGMYGYKMFSIAETNDYITGRCEEDEVAPRSVNSNGASALSLFTSCNPFSEFVGTGSYSAYNSALNTEETLTATSSSIISQKDADNKALLAAAVKAQCYADGVPEAGQECNAAQSVSVTVQCTGGLRVHKENIPISWSCLSATNNPDSYVPLHGFSAWDDGTYNGSNPTAWKFQYRKFKILSRSGCNGFYLTRTGGPSSGIDTVDKRSYGGTWTFDADGTQTNECTNGYIGITDYGPLPNWDDLPCEATNPTSTNLSPEVFGPNEQQLYQYEEVDIYESNQEKNRYYNLKATTYFQQNPVVGSNSSTQYYSTICYKMRGYQSPYESSILTEGVVLGNECTANVFDAETTLPESTGPLGFKGTVVRNVITIGTQELALTSGGRYYCKLTVDVDGEYHLFYYDFIASNETHTFNFDIPLFVGSEATLVGVCVDTGVFEIEQGCLQIIPEYSLCNGIEVDVPYPPDQQSITTSFSVPSGAFCAQSQVQADQLAYNYGIEQATAIGEAQLDCVYPNEQQSYTASCEGTIVGNAVVPAGAPIGDPVTVIIPAGTYYSDTVAHANAIALAEAQAQAEEQLSCFWTNTPQTANYCCEYFPDRCASVTVPFNRYNSTVSQADANNLAYAAALLQAEALVYCLSDISDGGGETIII